MLNIAATTRKGDIRGNFSCLSSKGENPPCFSTGQEHELLQSINYFCYLQMDQVSDLIQALQEESSRRFVEALTDALRRCRVTFWPLAVGGGRGWGKNKD